MAHKIIPLSAGERSRESEPRKHAVVEAGPGADPVVGEGEDIEAHPVADAVRGSNAASPSMPGRTPGSHRQTAAGPALVPITVRPSAAATGSGTWKASPPCRSRRRIRCSARTSSTDRNPLIRITHRCCPWCTRNVRLFVPGSSAGVMSVPGGKPHKGSSAAANSRPAAAGPPSWRGRRDCDIAPLRLPPVASDAPRRGRMAQWVSPRRPVPPRH